MSTVLMGTRFGNVEFDETDVLRIEGGLVGLPELESFLLFETKEGSAFSWLQSIEQPNLAFLVVAPERYVPTYPEKVVSKCPGFNDPVVLTTASIPPGKPNDTTINLAGPIIIDATTRKGRQMVLEDAAYTTRYRVFPSESAPQGQAA